MEWMVKQVNRLGGAMLMLGGRLRPRRLRLTH